MSRMTVAQMFPALRQPDGSVWYRSGRGEQAGWSPNAEYADPSYFADGAPAPVTLGCVRGIGTATDGDLDQLAAFAGQLSRQADATPQPHREDTTDGHTTGDAGEAAVLPGLPVVGEPEVHTADGHRPEAGVVGAPEPAGGLSMELTADGTQAARFTRTMQYPLPPAPPRLEVKMSTRWQYRVKHPETGLPCGFTRATTVAKVCDDTYHLDRWSDRELVRHVLTFLSVLPEHANSGQERAEIEERLARVCSHSRNAKIAALNTVELVTEALFAGLAAGDKGDLNDILDLICEACGSENAKELGECVHAWMEALDLGMVRYDQLPEFIKPYADAYLELLRRHGVVPVPKYVERTVLNDRGEEINVGTLDRIFRVLATGELILGDIKTSESLEFAYLAYGVQLAVYGYSTLMLSLDHQEWEPMPEIGMDYALLIHLPRGNPAGSSAVTFDLFTGGQGLVLSQDVRAIRKRAKKEIPYQHAVPPTTELTDRQFAAWRALIDLPAGGTPSSVWEQYEDVWSDDLTELGESIAKLRK